MTCSSCNEPMFVILIDRAFCERCYAELRARQRRVIEEFPAKKPAALGYGKESERG